MIIYDKIDFKAKSGIYVPISCFIFLYQVILIQKL